MYLIDMDGMVNFADVKSATNYNEFFSKFMEEIR